jgi:hypothetical protein
MSEIIGVAGWSYPSALRVSLVIAAYAAAYSLSAADDMATSMILLLQHTGPFSCQSFIFLGDTAAAKSSIIDSKLEVLDAFGKSMQDGEVRIRFGIQKEGRKSLTRELTWLDSIWR